MHVQLTWYQSLGLYFLPHPTICKIFLDIFQGLEALSTSHIITDPPRSSWIRRGPLQFIITTSAEAAQCGRLVFLLFMVIFPAIFYHQREAIYHIFCYFSFAQQISSQPFKIVDFDPFWVRLSPNSCENSLPFHPILWSDHWSPSGAHVEILPLTTKDVPAAVSYFWLFHTSATACCLFFIRSVSRSIGGAHIQHLPLMTGVFLDTPGVSSEFLHLFSAQYSWVLIYYCWLLEVAAVRPFWLLVSFFCCSSLLAISSSCVYFSILC